MPLLGAKMSALSIAFGEKLRSVRKSKGFSQDRLALAAGIDRSYMGRIERGEVNITLERLYMIAGTLKCPPQDLLPDFKIFLESQ